MEIGRYVRIDNVNFTDVNGVGLTALTPSTLVRVQMDGSNILNQSITMILTLGLYKKDGTIKQSQSTSIICNSNQPFTIKRSMLLPSNVSDCYLVAKLQKYENGILSMLSSDYIFPQ